MNSHIHICPECGSPLNGDHAPTAVADSGGPAELAEIRARIVHDAEHKVVARTRSAAIVAEIEQEIVEQGWPIGASIGHEAQLMERFDVSRSVLREAIRTLESSGVVTVRTYDERNRLRTSTNQSTTAQIQYFYDTRGNLSYVIPPEGNRIELFQRQEG